MFLKNWITEMPMKASIEMCMRMGNTGSPCIPRGIHLGKRTKLLKPMGIGREWE